VFRAQDETAARALVLGSTRFDVHLRGLSDYRVVSPGIYQIVLGEGTSEIIARPGGYYTVAATRDGVRVFEDPAHTDPARAQLVLYNLSNLEAVDLRTEGADTIVIPPLSPGAAGRITVNAVSVRLAVFSNGGFHYGLGDLGLERGSSYSVFVFDENRETGVFWAEAALTLD
jgi:alginate O-acetyltransferase complex protein AlgF